MTYMPPTETITPLVTDLIGDHPDCPADLVEAVVEEAAKLAAQVIAPLNHSGDQDGATLKDGVVTTAAGFKDAYIQYRDAGWNAIPFSPDYGGQGLPWVVAFAVQEMWQGANMAFGLCPLLNQGAIEAIETHGSQEQKDSYLPKLISGEWTGTMNLTEPQAGSDLSAIRSKAEPTGDGSYKITGQKIYITYGEHDFTDNIIHLVLARLPDAPEGVKGISLFVVPKILSDGTRNDVICSGIEHKLGIHASPTCTMNFGDKGGATGWLVGKENEGLKAMFTMMNNARLSVGLQGVAISEAATQKAVTYAAERVQGKAITSGQGAQQTAVSDKNTKVTIDQHPDVRRMILTMQAMTQAGRAMAYYAAGCLDQGKRQEVDILTPIVKSWCTDRSVEIASLGVQIHGGMGFVEETGAAQFYRDARILPIYEGTNGIQAMDLVFRKLGLDQGAAFTQWVNQCKTDYAGFTPDWDAVLTSAKALGKMPPDQAAMLAVPFLEQCGFVLGAAMLERYADKNLSAFYNRHILVRAHALAQTIQEG